MKRAWVGIVGMCFSAFVFGGDIGGTGGDGVLCKLKSGITTFDLLDYFEGERHKDSLVPDLGDSSVFVDDKIYMALERLSYVDRIRAQKYLTLSDEFFGQVEWVTEGPPLDNIQDAGPVDIPKNCELKQIAIRRPKFHPSVKPYLIDKRLWRRLSPDHQAGLILHEIIYGEMSALGHPDSSLARRYNAYIASDTFEYMGSVEYKKLEAIYFKEFHTPELKQSVFKFKIYGGKQWKMDLNSLLKNPSAGVEWHLFQPKPPSWLVLDKKSGQLMGIPTLKDVGQYRFTLVAKSGEKGAFAELEIEVLP